MSLVALLNSQPEIQKQVTELIEGDVRKAFVLVSAKNNEEALEVLSFDLPEIVLWNATDPQFDTVRLVEALQRDSWMHNFGIVALYDPRVAKEIEVNEKLAGANILAFLPLGAVQDHLMKHLRLLDANRQILVHLELGVEAEAKSTGSFNIANDPTIVPVYAGLAAQNLVQRGYLQPERKRDLQIALTELIQNGIEHGHVGLSSQEKSDFLAHGGNLSDLIRQKVDADPLIESTRVTLEWEIRLDETRFFVRDQGKGFDVQAYRQKLKDHALSSLSGRGIKLARSIGGKLSYNARGNVACLQLQNATLLERKTPRGFEADEVLVVQKGDTIFEQDEHSDHIFYIVSGQFGVYHDGVPVGMNTPADVFMGEMSFLMNNKRTATVLCESSGRLVKISRRSFVRTLREYPQYGLFLAKLMARKLSHGNQQQARKAINSLTGDAWDAVL